MRPSETALNWWMQLVWQEVGSRGFPLLSLASPGLPELGWMKSFFFHCGLLDWNMVKIHLLLSMPFFPCQIYSLSVTEPICYLQKQWPCVSLWFTELCIGQEAFSSINLVKGQLFPQSRHLVSLLMNLREKRNDCYWWSCGILQTVSSFRHSWPTLWARRNPNLFFYVIQDQRIS